MPKEIFSINFQHDTEDFIDEVNWDIIPIKPLSTSSFEKVAACDIEEIIIKFKRNDFGGYYKLKVQNSLSDKFDDFLEEC